MGISKTFYDQIYIKTCQTNGKMYGDQCLLQTFFLNNKNIVFLILDFKILLK